MIIASSVLILTFLSVFGWWVTEWTKGKTKLPSGVNQTVETIFNFPNLFKAVEKEITSVPETFVKTDSPFVAVNKLDRDVWMLTSYHNDKNKRTIAMINLRTGEEGKTWAVNKFPNSQDRICHTVMLPDSSIIYNLEWYSGLRKLDANGNELWRNDSMAVHHGKNLAADGTLWACTYDKEGYDGMSYAGSFTVGDKKFPYLDNSITQYDVETGDILYHKGLAEIMVENDLTHLFVKTDSPWDPIHLNDVQPVLEDGTYWKKNDLWLSARNGAWLMLFRPSTGKVIELIEGPFYSQHDVDVESDSTIIVFNNNTPQRQIWAKGDKEVRKPGHNIGVFTSQAVRCYMGTRRFEVLDRKLFEANDIYSFTEGEVERLSDGSLFVEEQNSSVYWIIKDGQVVYKNILPSHIEGYHHLANWARIME